jgi:elongator complex protein 1
MRSLQLVGHTSSGISGSSSQKRSFITNDPESNTTYVALEDEQTCIKIMATTGGQDSGFVQLAVTPGPSGGIISFTYLSDLQAICMGSRNGDIILIHKERFDKGDDPVSTVCIAHLPRLVY